jgi:outer membrane murein-binding lipoprotein Lpp
VRAKLASASIALCVCSSGVSWAANDITRLAEQLTTLRAEVEELAEELENQKIDTRGKLSSISSQRSDLEMQVQREELRVKQLRQARQKRMEEVQVGDDARAQLTPTVLASIANVRESVSRGLPFKVEDRVAELNKLEAQIQDQIISPEQGASRLWQFVEDELRLTRENGMYRQMIILEGEEVLADVVRLGMVALYFKTNDARYGYVERAGSGWAYVAVTDEEGTEQLELLFDTFKVNIRVGYFELQNGLIRQSKESKCSLCR